MATILFVDDEQAARQNYSTILEHYGHDVLLASSVREAVDVLKSGRAIDLILTDMRMGVESGLDMLREAKRIVPEIEVIVLTGHAEIENAIEAMKLGASDYITKDTDYKEILVILDKALEKRDLKTEINRLRTKLQDSQRHIVGSSAAIRAVLDMIARVAHTDSRVLITGESGTGKELVAETIHANSGKRASGPFIAINCGAIPRDLQESELFGHVRGAFTGADRDKQGLLEAGNRGTVFLDEVAEMTPETQVKLLRVLETGEVLRVGSTQPRKLDIRIIAATNKDLRTLTEEHRFRDDLYYRLKVVSIHTPPLRDRIEDLPLLAAALIEELNPKTRTHITGISDDAMQALLEYPWPGNVRELKNVLERAMIFADSNSIEIENLPEDLFTRKVEKSLSKESGQIEKDGILPLEEAEKRHIIQTLERLGGNKLLTARHLNIATTTLYRKLRMYGIE
jgi:two-component system, NtrC family, response regulator HydG